MLKEIFLKKLKTQSKTVHNAIITLGDTDDSGKGRKFKSRFIQPGVAGYPGQFGNVLITKQTFDKFINTMVGVPVIINHKDLTQDNADNERIGVVSNVWYDEKDGWYWCDGVIWDETAQNLITNKGWSVSCSYDVKLADDAGGTENNIKYDMEFLDGVFTHLAIVDNPRYERANIVFNSKTVIQNYNPYHDREGKFCSGNGVNPNYKEQLKQVIEKAKNSPNERQKLVIGKVSKDLEEEAKNNGFDIANYEHDLDVSGTRHAFKEHGQAKTEEPRGQIAINDADFEKIPEVIYDYDEVHFTGPNKIGRETITYKKGFPDGTIMYIEEIRDKKKTLTINTLYKYKNTGNPRTFVNNNNPLSNASISIITDTDTNFNPKEQEMLNNVDNDKWITKFDKEGEPYHVNIDDTDDNTDNEPEKLSQNRIKKITVPKKGGGDREIEYVDKAPKGWAEIEGATTAPRGYTWYSNGKSVLSGNRERILVKNNKENADMALLDELKNLISRVENAKEGDKMDKDDKKDEKKIDNEKVDKRDLIRQIMAIAGKHEDNEDVRTIAKLAEKLAYDKSEAGTADNEKDEDKEKEKDKKKVEEIKEEVKEDVENMKKCNNAIENSKPDYFAKMNEVYNSAMQAKEIASEYVSREEKLQRANEYFA